MHVVLVGDHPMPGQNPHGGVQRVVHSLRRAIAGHVRVTLIVPAATVDARHTDASGDCIYLAAPRVPGTLVYWNLVARRIGQEIARLQPDVVHVQDSAGYMLAWPHAAQAIPVVFTVHGILHKDILQHGATGLRGYTATARAWLTEAVERRARHRADDVIVISTYVLDEMPDVRSMAHHQIPNPVDAIFLSGEPRPHLLRERLEICQVGGVWPRKNTLGAIEIIAALAKLGHAARLTIIGPTTDPAYLAVCHAKIAELGAKNNVRLLGALPAADIVAELDHTDLLLLTSLQETAPMVVAEAQCRGVPTAVPRAFGLPYMVDEGVNGVFLTSVDGPADAARIAAFLATRPDPTSIAVEARRLYDIDTIASRTVDIYRAAAARRQVQSAVARHLS